MKGSGGYYEKGCCEKFAGTLFKLISAILTMGGLGLIAYSIYLITRVREKESGKEHPKDESLLQIGEHYWFPEAVLAFGLWTLLSSLFAFLGARMEKMCCLGTHAVFTVIALLAEATFVILFHFNKEWDLKHLVPLDDSDGYGDLRHFIRHHMKASLYVGIAVLVLQTLSLMLSLLLWACLRSRNESVDDEQDSLDRPMVSEEQRGSYRTGSGARSRRQRDDPWSKRMMEKYGLDTNKFTYDPERGRSRMSVRDRSPIHEEEKKGWCTIM